MPDCPPLTRLTPPLPDFITVDNVMEPLVSTYDTAPETTVTVSCQLNLVLNGADNLTCTAAGIWDKSPLPTCTVPTTTAAPEMSTVDEPLALMVTLGVVAVLILTIIIVIIVALYYGHYKRQQRQRSTKREYSYYGDSTTHVNSESERHGGERHVTTVYNNGYPVLPLADYDNHVVPTGQRDTALHGDADDGDRVYNVERTSARDDVGPTLTSHRDLYDVVTPASDGRRGLEGRRCILNYPQYYHGRYIYPHGSSGVVFPHAHSDIYPDREVNRSKVKDRNNEDSDDNRTSLRRSGDTHIWRDMQSDWSLKIPRPVYEV